jgi:hypothetical protein
MCQTPVTSDDIIIVFDSILQAKFVILRPPYLLVYKSITKGIILITSVAPMTSMPDKRT